MSRSAKKAKKARRNARRELDLPAITAALEAAYDEARIYAPKFNNLVHLGWLKLRMVVGLIGVDKFDDQDLEQGMEHLVKIGVFQSQVVDRELWVRRNSALEQLAAQAE